MDTLIYVLFSQLCFIKYLELYKGLSMMFEKKKKMTKREQEI
jgi:hypothetical protein